MLHLIKGRMFEIKILFFVDSLKLWKICVNDLLICITKDRQLLNHSTENKRVSILLPGSRLVPVSIIQCKWLSFLFLISPGIWYHILWRRITNILWRITGWARAGDGILSLPRDSSCTSFGTEVWDQPHPAMDWKWERWSSKGKLGEVDSRAGKNSSSHNRDIDKSLEVIMC